MPATGYQVVVHLRIWSHPRAVRSSEAELLFQSRTAFPNSRAVREECNKEIKTAQLPYLVNKH
jgi:hypothetical protein